MGYVFSAHWLWGLTHVSCIYLSLYDESTNPTTHLPEYHYCWWPDTEWWVGGRSHKGRTGQVRIICLTGANETWDEISSERAGRRRRRAKDRTNQISIDHLQQKQLCWLRGMAVSSAMWAIMLILSIWMNLIDWLWRRGGRSGSSAVSKRLVLSSLQNDERWRDLWNFHYTCVREAISCEAWRQIVQEITQITRVWSSSLHFPGLSIKAVAPQRHLKASWVYMFSHFLQLSQILLASKCYE